MVGPAKVRQTQAGFQQQLASSFRLKDFRVCWTVEAINKGKRHLAVFAQVPSNIRQNAAKYLLYRLSFTLKPQNLQIQTLFSTLLMLAPLRDAAVHAKQPTTFHRRVNRSVFLGNSLNAVQRSAGGVVTRERRAGSR